MKKILMILVMFVIITSCGNSPYKKRKNCKGNGSWYGNRHLGSISDNDNTFKYF